MNEARILKNLKHPNIPVIYDIEEDHKYSYIIEEFLEGQSLKAFRLYQSNIQEELVIDIAIQICDVFQYIHAMKTPILFLDLKPDNLIIQNNTIKLIDFGSAVFLEESSTREVSFGTKGYAAPEQYEIRKLDERSDIYGLGVLLYFLVTKENYSEKFHTMHCSKRLIAIIKKCMKYDPSKRYQDVTQLRKNLLSLQQDKLPDCSRKSKTSLTIAIAGAQRRIGTTHISFLITSYINQYVEKSIYMEKNDHRVIHDILDRYVGLENSQVIQVFHKCPILIRNIEEIEDTLTEYRIRICDYGVLTQENIEVYGEADIKLLILGAKDWEMNYSIQALREVMSYDDIHYLFNFMEGNEFLDVLKDMEHERCIRVPYNPNPFQVANPSMVKEFIEEFFQEKGNEKKTKTFKKYLRFRGTKQ